MILILKNKIWIKAQADACAISVQFNMTLVQASAWTPIKF